MKSIRLSRLAYWVADARLSARRQGGAILIAVMMVMLFFTFLVGAMIGHAATSEADAVEQHLARIRTYWAVAGVLDYTAGRAFGESNSHLDTDWINGTNTGATSFTSFPGVNKIYKELGTAAGNFIYDYSLSGSDYTHYFFAIQETATDLHPNVDDGLMTIRLQSLDPTGYESSVAPVLLKVTNNAQGLIWKSDVCIGQNNAARGTPCYVSSGSANNRLAILSWRRG